MLVNKYMNDITYKSLICYNGNMAKILRVVEIHNNTQPLLPILFIKCSPRYGLRQFFAKFLKFLIIQHLNSNIPLH